MMFVEAQAIRRACRRGKEKERVKRTENKKKSNNADSNLKQNTNVVQVAPGFQRHTSRPPFSVDQIKTKENGV